MSCVLLWSLGCGPLVAGWWCMQQLSSMLELFGCKCFGSSNYGLVLWWGKANSTEIGCCFVFGMHCRTTQSGSMCDWAGCCPPTPEEWEEAGLVHGGNGKHVMSEELDRQSLEQGLLYHQARGVMWYWSWTNSSHSCIDSYWEVPPDVLEQVLHFLWEGMFHSKFKFHLKGYQAPWLTSWGKTMCWQQLCNLV